MCQNLTVLASKKFLLNFESLFDEFWKTYPAASISKCYPKFQFFSHDHGFSLPLYATFIRFLQRIGSNSLTLSGS